MDLGRAFTFMLDDEDGLGKVLIAVLVSLAGIFILPLPILTGYMVAVARRVKQGDDSLPPWDDFVRYWLDGVVITVAMMVYTLPFWLVPGALFIGALLTGGAGSQDLADTLLLGSMALSCLSTLLWVVLSLLLGPVLTLMYIQEGRFAALFQVGRVTRFIRACFPWLLQALGIGLVLGFVIGVIGTVFGIIPCLGWLLMFALTPYPVMVMGHVYGQIARQCPAVA